MNPYQWLLEMAASFPNCSPSSPWVISGLGFRHPSPRAVLHPLDARELAENRLDKIFALMVLRVSERGQSQKQVDTQPHGRITNGDSALKGQDGAEKTGVYFGWTGHWGVMDLTPTSQHELLSWPCCHQVTSHISQHQTPCGYLHHRHWWVSGRASIHLQVQDRSCREAGGVSQVVQRA